MRLRSIGVVLLGLLLTGASTAWAQVATTGTIQVIIEDPQGGRLPGVTVQATATDTVTSRQGVTDAEGVATLEALQPSARYIVKAQLSGFRDMERTEILVRSGQVTTLRVELQLSTVSETVTVQGQTTPLVDVTRATSGTDITLSLTEALPTGRSYQSFLQLVPGVMPDSQNATGNPASRSGMNWKDVVTNDNLGYSTDNFYYFEGINVTDPVTGTFGANLNTEVIQEQKVITGGIPAEYVGAAGLISTVITKSGTNSLSGSGTYFFQNNNLVAKNENLADNTFSSNDAAFTVGGPIVKNNLWAFGSFRYLKNTNDVNAQDTRQVIRTVETTQKQSFFKTTYAPSQKDTLSFVFLSDPFDRSGTTDPSVPNNRDRVRKQGGNRYSGSYSRIWGTLLLDATFASHDAEITDLSVDRTARNTIAYQRTTTRTLADEQLGGFGQDFPETRPTRQFRIAAQYQIGAHRLKGGYEWAQRKDIRDLLYLPDSDRSQYTSIANLYGPITAGSIANSTLWSTRQFNVNNASDYNGLISRINTLPNRASFYSQYDTNGDGTISVAELGNSLVFNSSAGNPNQALNYYRITQTAVGKQDQQVRSNGFYVQDEFPLGRFTFNLGLRAEMWEHFSTTGFSIFKFDTTWAPRLSAVYDVKGDGSQKASAYWGRYFDPIRMDMANFAGTTNGSTREEQVFINNQWVTYRVRGFSAIPDGLFAPATKTPYTDELQLAYEADLGNNQSVSATYYKRNTRDIFEDFDPGIYTIPANYTGLDGNGDVNAPNSLFLGYGYLGFDPANPPRANFFLGTLKGGERNYNGLELVYRKRFSNSWQSIVSYSYLDAKGNTVSDGNADFAGDVFWLDPRAPNMYGTIPGTIHNLFKASGTYATKWNIDFGATYSWNSGSIVNKTQLASSRRLPIQVSTPFVYGGLLEDWVAPDAVGAVQNPSWGQMDLRAQYTKRVGKASFEVSMDIFNLLNDQAVTRIEDLVAGTGSTQFGSPIAWRNPRRAFLGLRFRY
ncbi:MAG: carboxypeptidase regulatory-like domain-containing protein [Vicinamibacterales bacterium]